MSIVKRYNTARLTLDQIGIVTQRRSVDIYCNILPLITRVQVETDLMGLARPVQVRYSGALEVAPLLAFSKVVSLPLVGPFARWKTYIFDTLKHSAMVTYDVFSNC